MSAQLGKYYLLDLIATGGMAEIWLAKQVGAKGFEKLVVIKKILPSLVKDKEFIQMFFDEANIASQLNHPNVVQIYDLEATDNNYYIAMEYIFGEDLRNIVIESTERKNPLPLFYAFHIISQAALGLHHAHTHTDVYGNSLNIVHRDISPQNILVSYNGNVKVVDFGVAKAATRSQKTEAGILKGKVGYMSPEQAMGYQIDGRSDIFALGIVLYEITLGKRLFMSDSALRVLKMITEDNITPPHLVHPAYPKELSSIIMGCLERDVNKRFQSGLELHLKIEETLKKYSPSLGVELTQWMQKVFADKIQSIKDRNRKILEAHAEIMELTFDDDSKNKEITDDFDFDDETKNRNKTTQKISKSIQSSLNIDEFDESPKSNQNYKKSNTQQKGKRVDFDEDSGLIFAAVEKDMYDIADETIKVADFIPTKNRNISPEEEIKKGSKSDPEGVSKGNRVKNNPQKNMNKIDENLYDSIENTKSYSQKKEWSFFGFLFKFIIISVILYFVYIGSTIGYIYFSANFKFAKIAETVPMVNDDESIKSKVVELCKRNSDILCDNESILVDRNKEASGFILSYSVNFRVFFYPLKLKFTPIITEKYPF
ncbi:serine/threonine protein kinase [bacterium]|nr:serine/threonine protein kinase [bacterium]